jgi:uncharacterized membrane protein SpoIIM required for sporulation
MEELTVKQVFKQLPFAAACFFLSLIFGALFAFFLQNFNKEILEKILSLWSKRILLGVMILGEKFSIAWFILNNLIALLLIVVSCLLILLLPRSQIEFKRFRSFEKRRPKIILSALYIIPIGALTINGFLLSLFSTYVLLNYGKEKFLFAILLTFPHGINEILALLFATSLVLAYLQILKPIILRGNLKLAVKKIKNLIASRVTIFFTILIILLVLFSGVLEGILTMFLK